LYNGAPAAAAQVTLSLTGTAPPGYTITSAGVINVPAGAAAGAVSITYELCEAGTTSNCDTAAVALLIAPAAADDTYTTSAGQPLVGDVSINDNAPAGATYSVLTPPAAGTFTLQANGSFSYTPAGAGPQTLQYQGRLPAPDAGPRATAPARLTLLPNTPPVTGTQPGSFTLAANDNVPAGATFTVPVAPTKGTAVLAADGTLQYTATAGQSGADTLTYQVCLPAPDGTTCDTAQVAINIAAAALVAVNEDYSAGPIPPSGGSTPSVLLNDTFNGAAIVPGNTPVTASMTTLVSGYSMAANGVVTVAPGTTPAATTLTYQVCENAQPANCAQATALVAVRPNAADDT
ncbi:Ig-like domain-containing protein, partial [Pseudomonas sp. K8]|uniref:Ig-like domain-containing protein n=1 Tax=Pseudomonas sp. K8 TaxID=212200 RepID=UPI001D022771